MGGNGEACFAWEVELLGLGWVDNVELVGLVWDRLVGLCWVRLGRLG